MNDRQIFGTGVAIVAAGAVLAYLVWPQPAPAPRLEGDGPGPNLEIEVAGATEGEIVIDLLPAAAPAHVARIVDLTRQGRYNGVVFHRVIPEFMAQTGDVEFGQVGTDLSQAGMGGSDLPDLVAEFSDVPFDQGIVGMARSASPDSANSQFFITTAPALHLNGQYTVVGRVLSGFEVVLALKAGDPNANGAVEDPDYIASARIAE
ncbi:MAG: peptidylprolyl isomerase [Paracoccaceae bacterium]|nr:peptidylprolyl isomerase [Paracoccaceae bacterium]